MNALACPHTAAGNKNAVLGPTVMALDDHLHPATFTDWLEDRLDRQQLRDLAQYGAGVGWPGLTYYTETSRLYQRYHEEVWEALAEDADALGCASIPAYVATFATAPQIVDDATFRNTLIWYLAERAAHNLVDA